MEHRSSRIFNLLAIAFWLFLAGLRLAQAWEKMSPLALALTFQTGLVAYWLTGRRSERLAAPLYQKAVAWLSALLPLALQVECSPGYLPVGISLAGLALVIWSLFSLGNSFGIAPADRGLVRRGPYLYLRHPMYAGELLALLGAVWSSWSAWNIAIWTVLLSAVWLRIFWEQRLLAGYTDYARQVRWRLLPGVW
jgi:protein-S-isoprenylcysteine O-methyltransferase Ste14